MRTQGKYILGEIKEVAAYLAHVYYDKQSIYFSFVMTDETECELEDIFRDAEGFYGVHTIDSGFDVHIHEGLIELVANYYGGWCGCYREFDFSVESEEYFAKVLQDLIIGTMSRGEEVWVNEFDTIIAEMEERYDA